MSISSVFMTAANSVSRFSTWRSQRLSDLIASLASPSLLRRRECWPGLLASTLLPIWWVPRWLDSSLGFFVAPDYFSSGCLDDPVAGFKVCIMDVSLFSSSYDRVVSSRAYDDRMVLVLGRPVTFLSRKLPCAFSRDGHYNPA